jgi:WD40 repeat protein
VDGGGLIKIWDVQKGICEKTEEGHEEKIWSLRALPPIEEELSNLAKPKARFATGGADGRLIIWEDKSEELKQKRQKEMAKRATDQQTLTNLLDQDRLFEALVLTLDLDQPFQSVKLIFTNFCKLLFW